MNFTLLTRCFIILFVLSGTVLAQSFESNSLSRTNHTKSGWAQYLDIETLFTNEEISASYKGNQQKSPFLNSLVTFNEKTIVIHNPSNRKMPLEISVYSPSGVLEYIEYKGAVYAGSSLTQAVSVLDSDFALGHYIYIFKSGSEELARLFVKDIE